MHLYKVDSRWVAGRNRVAGMCELTWIRRLTQTDNAYSLSRTGCHDAFASGGAMHETKKPRPCCEAVAAACAHCAGQRVTGYLAASASLTLSTSALIALKVSSRESSPTISWLIL
ncbi:hypothetical protein ACVIGV_006097 [Rhizobium leguminosarum]